NLIEWRISPAPTQLAQTMLQQREAIREVAAVPGVTGAAVWSSKLTRRVALGASVLNIGPNFFDVMGIPIVNGRNFNASEQRGVTRLAIINEAIALRLFPNTDPVGKQLPAFEALPGHALDIRIGPGSETNASFDPSGMTIIGVAKNNGVGQPGHRFG